MGNLSDLSPVIYITLVITAVVFVAYLIHINYEFLKVKYGHGDESDVELEEKTYSIEALMASFLFVFLMAQAGVALYFNDSLPFFNSDSFRKEEFISEVMDDPEPAFVDEITESTIDTSYDPLLEQAVNSLDATSDARQTTNTLASSATYWKSTTDKDVYNNGTFWNGAATSARSSCALREFRSVSSKSLQIGQHYVRFHSDNNYHVNYYLLNPKYKVNGVTNYNHLERHIPGFYTKPNISKYQFVNNDSSNLKGYTSFTARLDGYYLYKTSVLTPSGSYVYYLYKVKCGSARTITGITAPKAVSGATIRDKAASQIGNAESPLGSNCGSQITKYLSYVGLGCGQPWCAGFVSWVYGNSALGLVNKPTLKETGADAMMARLKEPAFSKYVSVKSVTGTTSDNFMPGDILIRDPGMSTGHVGIVKSYNGSTLVTVEGNSSNKVSQNTYSGRSYINSRWSFYGHWKRW